MGALAEAQIGWVEYECAKTALKLVGVKRAPTEFRIEEEFAEMADANFPTDGNSFAMCFKLAFRYSDVANASFGDAESGAPAGAGRPSKRRRSDAPTFPARDPSP